jgi:hypothetical protein
MKRFYEFSTSWTVTEVYEIDMPDDPDGLITSYEEHCGDCVTYMPDRRDEALEEMRTGLAREFVHGPGARLAGVEMDQSDDVDMHVVECTHLRRHLMHPRVWSMISRAIVLLDPLEQLCAVMTSAQPSADFEDGAGI